MKCSARVPGRFYACRLPFPPVSANSNRVHRRSSTSVCVSFTEPTFFDHLPISPPLPATAHTVLRTTTKFQTLLQPICTARWARKSAHWSCVVRVIRSMPAKSMRPAKNPLETDKYTRAGDTALRAEQVQCTAQVHTLGQYIQGACHKCPVKPRRTFRSRKICLVIACANAIR